jgi:hypothetical protein
MSEPLPQPQQPPDRLAKVALLKGAPHAPPRHALGLPAGSVRAVLAFTVLGLIWALMFTQREVPLYLQYLMFMILGHYFAARRRPAPADLVEPAPLYLPRGVIRTFIFLGFVGVFVSIWYQHRDNLDELAEELKADRLRNKYLPLLMVAAFFVGLLAAKAGRLLQKRQAVQARVEDIQAWLSLVAAVLLAVEVVIQLLLNPSLGPERQIHLPHLENVLAAIVGFYFGARS